MIRISDLHQFVYQSHQRVFHKRIDLDRPCLPESPDFLFFPNDISKQKFVIRNTGTSDLLTNLLDGRLRRFGACQILGPGVAQNPVPNIRIDGQAVIPPPKSQSVPDDFVADLFIPFTGHHIQCGLTDDKL